jgi:uncharacterized protein YecT (DUF1311 family)
MQATPLSGALSCPRHQRTTIDFEGCEEVERLKLNTRFDQTVGALWPMLDATSRRAFANGQKAWVRFARQECDVASREYLGGSEAPVEAGWCFVGLTRARAKEVAGMLALYCQGKIRSGPARRCPRQ